MNNINWNDYYSENTLKARRDYLRNVFKDKQKWVNQNFFVVNPIDSQEDNFTLKKSIRNKKKQTVNIFRRLARHIILPFPITWTHKNSDRLVQKRVISIEDYMMGDLIPKDFFSALRIGVSQYPNFLFGAAFTLAGLAATLAVAMTASIGLTIPIAGFCLGLGYIAYASMRAIRKPKTIVGYLKSKMLNEKRGHKVEQLFVKMYTFVNILEKEKKAIKRNSPSKAKKRIEASIINEISNIFYEGEDKRLVQSFSILVESLVSPFIEKMNSTNYTSNDKLLDDLNELIIKLEDIDIVKNFKKMKISKNSCTEDSSPEERKTLVEKTSNIHENLTVEELEFIFDKLGECPFDELNTGELYESFQKRISTPLNQDYYKSKEFKEFKERNMSIIKRDNKKMLRMEI